MAVNPNGLDLFTRSEPFKYLVGLVDNNGFLYYSRSEPYIGQGSAAVSGVLRFISNELVIAGGIRTYGTVEL